MKTKEEDEEGVEEVVGAGERECDEVGCLKIKKKR